MTRRHFAIVATALLAVGACSSQEAVTSQSNTPTIPPVTDPVTTTPEAATTVPEEPETSSTAPDTTVADTTTTVPPTTTIAPPSGDPTSTPTEFFGGGDADGWLYLGRWTGNAWEAAVQVGGDQDQDQDGAEDESQEEDEGQVEEEDDTIIDPTISDDTDVLVHELDVETIDGSVTGSDDACSTGRPGPIIGPNARAPEDPGFGYRSIAFDADWTTRPRRVEVVDADVAAYVEAGVAAFDDADIDASGGSISQLTLADLDGDGDTESVAVFDGEGFSAVLLIDAQTSESITVARSIQTSTIAPAGGGEGSPAPIITPNDQHRVLDLVDVNGDGLMEVVVHTYVDEDDTEVSIFTYDGSEVDAVLSQGC